MSLPYTIAGIMSGTSLDGLDIAICRFEEVTGRWTFEVKVACTNPYPDHWKKRLDTGFDASANELAALHADFGAYIGACVLRFCNDQRISPDFISSHGHTMFHQPSKGYTFQVGSGAHIAAISGIDTICDFRTTDVAFGGQGAPLVPIGDAHLFGGHRFCLNLGGIANISYDKNEKRTAFDICPVNMALNYLSNKLGKPYDKDGELALMGKVIPQLLDSLNALSFYHSPPPKSLGREWFEKEFLPLIANDEWGVPDRLRTVAEHIAIQISNTLFLSPGTTMLTTGGGAYNNQLIEVIEEQVSRHGIHVVVPDATIIEFKEAIIFAYLGLLRILERPNALASVTGASEDAVCGAVYKG